MTSFCLKRVKSLLWNIMGSTFSWEANAKGHEILTYSDEYDPARFPSDDGFVFELPDAVLKKLAITENLLLIQDVGDSKEGVLVVEPFLKQASRKQSGKYDMAIQGACYEALQTAFGSSLQSILKGDITSGLLIQPFPQIEQWAMKLGVLTMRCLIASQFRSAEHMDSSPDSLVTTQ